ncbi:Cu(I)/Ag(I) efflux system membrane fusion protein [Wenyingzhuangia heitensis]|uniref:Cu(I)/Ag(I) efflux system membrane fusion protein n=1 Tax=Wenyingzhuangia heitensis TaxID=1487859 RepID=A0ABX0UC14_9FLAO|nr:efflux RND transporter periplasmic adaptor subunit [Wenyingzhuangia heitensis]NIJ46369.1 Cu(I)/Ag(I) efflux system membrane fusion protein [Wenyingzhuangia heitensis]
MKKYIIYIILLVVGMFFLGWIFGDLTSKELTHKHSKETVAKQLWTCAMHPQIMQSEPGNCPICGMDLTPVDRNTQGLLTNQFKLTENAMALANIETTLVTNNTAEVSEINLSGKININADKTAIQPAHFNGRIEELYITSLGEKVTKGQKIAMVYSPELVAAQQELITAYSLKETQPELYKAVHTKFKNLKIHGTELDEVLKTGKVKTNFTIYSHVSGVVSEIAVSSGAHIMDGMPIFKVANLTTVWANFDVYENQISTFKKGQKIKITSTTYPNREFAGIVDFIDPILNSQTRTVSLRVVLSNKRETFKPGMFVEGTLKIHQTKQAQEINIPASAVLWTGKRSIIYKKMDKNEPLFEMKEVVLGNKMGAFYQILKGVSVGDEIVTNGTFTVDAAAQLQGKKSMMNPKEKTKNTDIYNSKRIEVSLEFKHQLNTIYKDYLTIKNALVKDDPKTVLKTSKILLENLSKINTELLTNNETQKQWNFIKKEIEITLDLILKSKEINKQRNYFKQLSKAFINAVEKFGVQEKVYKQYCPMSNSNKGAFWLSNNKEVLNPYFGKKMLTCGEVKQIIE